LAAVKLLSSPVQAVGFHEIGIWLTEESVQMTRSVNPACCRLLCGRDPKLAPSASTQNLEGSVRSRGTTADMALNATSLKLD